MGLNHEFILIKNEEDKLLKDDKFFINLLSKEFRDNLPYVKETISLTDDDIGHMFKSLSLVKSITPNNSNIKYGLNRHGITLFNSESFDILQYSISEYIRNYPMYSVDNTEKNIDILKKLKNMIMYLNYEDYIIIHLGI